MQPRSMRSVWVRSTALATVLMTLSPAAWSQTPAYSFDIPAEPLATALHDFARISGQQIIFSSDQVAGKSVAALRGEYSSEDALSRLLAGTDLVVDRAASGGIMVRPKNAEAASNDRAAEIPGVETVVVTGTNIRGIVNPTSPVFSYSRADIDKTGYATTQEFTRSLPQNFSGGTFGATEDGPLGAGAHGQSNVEGASTVNLRGLGEDSTLILLDGHRMAPSVLGSTVDISVIPLSAIDRIDVVADGASSIYGSDAVAGVVNFVLRKDFDGAESEVRYGSVTSDSFDQVTVDQIVGKSWETGNILANVQYDYQSSLPTTDRSFTSGAGQPTDLLPASNKLSVVASGHQELLPDLDISGDILFSDDNTKRRDTFDPADASSIKIPHTTVNISAGVGYEPFGDWRVELTGLYAKENTDTVYLSVTPAIFGYTPGTVAYRDAALLASVDLKADGTLLVLPGGAVKASIGGSFRSEDTTDFTTYSGSSRDSARHVSAVFGELYIPLIGDDNRFAFARHLDISAAIRYDHYSDVGGTTNPKIGILWSPIDGLNVRATLGTSFRAPNGADQLNSASGLSILNYAFASPTGPGTVPVFALVGIALPLLPEKSRNWTAGFDYQSPLVPGAKLSFDYYNVDFTNRIVSPLFDVNALLHPQVYGPLITPLANDVASAAYLASAIAHGDTFYDFLGTGSAGIRYAFNTAEQNAAVARQNGFDITGDYQFGWSEDHFDARANAAIINEIDTQFAPDSAVTDLVNTYSNPLHVKLRGDVTWTRGPLSVNGAINYSNAYVDTTATPYGTIAASTTFDLAMRYAPTDWNGSTLLSGTSIGVAAVNLFDSDPPYVVSSGGFFTGIHYDVGNGDPRGRFVSIDIRKTW